jgi:ribosomal protein S18 acetylase RimI-like enzyme
MALAVRPATPADAADELLYESARPYYDAYFGSPPRARRGIAAVYPRPGHTASFQICRVAELDGALAGVLAAFPVEEGDRLARRFVSLTAPRVPPWQWPRLVRHLRAAAAVSPHPPAGTYYVDALATAPGLRRRGVARALLEHAEREAAAAGLGAVSLDTGLHNASARALYAAAGFREHHVRRATEREARVVGGPGFVSYVKPVA